MTAFNMQAGSAHGQSVSEGKQAKGARQRQHPRKPIRVQKKKRKDHWKANSRRIMLAFNKDKETGTESREQYILEEGRQQDTGATH